MTQILSQKKYYKCLDVIRIVSCFAVLLYHLDFLRGGCLAVCSFFALSGYLSCVTNFNKEKFSFWGYYKNRLIKIYTPIVATVFITILAISFFPNVKLFNLKQEVASILLGFNNFWQLKANLDYFAQNLNSPFTHFWYISILMQFELIFPLIFIVIKKIAKKTSEETPVAITFFLAIASAIFFYALCFRRAVMDAYYNTFAHAFSWLFGISLGMSHSYNKNLMPIKFKSQVATITIFIFYMALLISMFVFINDKSEIFSIAISLTTILTICLMDYGAMIKNENSKILKTFSALTYEIYLAQYPVIFVSEQIFDFGTLNFLKLPLTVILILTFAFFIHFGLNGISGKKFLTIFMRVLIFTATAAGVYKFAIAKDYESEMQALQNQLEESRILMEEMQRKSEENQKNQVFSEESNSNSILNSNFIFSEGEVDLEEEIRKQKEGLPEEIKKMPIAAFGDSIMLGASACLYERFEGIYIDAKTSRQIVGVIDPLRAFLEKQPQTNPIVIHLGTNGPATEKTKEEIMRIAQERDIFWMNVTNDKIAKVNASLNDLAKKHPNLRIIDWENFSKGHNSFFGADGIHLTKEGREAYAKLIFDSLYDFYFEKLTAKENEVRLAKAAEEERHEKIMRLQEDILQFILKKKNSKNEIIARFISDQLSQDFIRERVAELENEGLIVSNKKGIYSLTKAGKEKAKKIKANSK